MKRLNRNTLCRICLTRRGRKHRQYGIRVCDECEVEAVETTATRAQMMTTIMTPVNAMVSGGIE